MYKNILVPTDGSRFSAAAVKQAVKLAKPIGARITALHVTPESQAFLDQGFVVPATTSPSLKRQFKAQAAARSRRILDAVNAEAAAGGVSCESVLVASNSPYESIIEQARKSHCDLIMMASHGRRGLSGLLLGSETSKVLVHSKIPVLVVR